VKVWIYRGEILDPKAAMARGTGSDPINETRTVSASVARARDANAKADRTDDDREQKISSTQKGTKHKSILCALCAFVAENNLC
jgi:hypothetical protein